MSENIKRTIEERIKKIEGLIRKLKQLPKEDLQLIRDYRQYMVEDWSAHWVPPSMSFAESFRIFLKKRTEKWPIKELYNDYADVELYYETYIEDLPVLKEMIREE